MSKKWNLIVDVAKCNGCYNCFIAAKDEYVGNQEPGYFASQPHHGHAWIKVHSVERGTYPAVDTAFMPTMCRHCDDAPCVKAATNGAVVKRDDGIVIIKPELAKGQKQIVDACPFDAVEWNEELQVPQAWPFDAHLLDRGWTRPRCEQVCATGAIKSLKVSDGEMEHLIEQDKLEVLDPEIKTKPRVYYKNLHRIKSALVGVHVERIHNGLRDCVENAEVVLINGNTKISTKSTDAYGDCRFDGLPLQGPFKVVVTAKGLPAKEGTVAANGYIEFVYEA